MGKQDYRDAIEKSRQEINVYNNMAPSRRTHRKAAKEKPRQKKSILLPTLFFLFILIPVSLLIYVAFLYEPNDTLTASSAKNEVSMELQTPEAPQVPVALEEEQADEEENEAAAEQQANTAEATKSQEEAAAKEAEAKAQLEQEQAEAKRQEEQAEAKRQEEQAEAKRQAELAEAKRQQEAEQKKQQEKQAVGKTHVVQPGETLYRIAVNAYGASGASAGVEKIKQANGLSSNEISVGATLILP